jgi:formate--tetrahydrofolate ligase
MKTDIEIAENAEILPISQIAEKIKLSSTQIIPYGHDKAKIDYESIKKLPQKAKLVLVTAINPTPAGEGKTTVTVGLTDALNLLNKKAIAALREPSMGPVFGRKGGAAGGGYAQVIPMEDINLHFTGDMHAITSAHNLIAAVIDNHLHFGNELQINSKKIFWRRVLDVNDRALRDITLGQGNKINGPVRESGFDITASSEIMTSLTLSKDFDDLKVRIARIVVALNQKDQPITVEDLKITGAILTLLKDAINPNLVQTLEHSPVVMHAGPFANIATGTNSVIATSTALKLGDYVVTEAGFGSDLGAEKFLDVKVPILEKSPDVIVIVATIRALKYNGGVELKDLNIENLGALENGLNNLKRHVNIMLQYEKPVIIALNRFKTDSDNEIKIIQDYASSVNVGFALANAFAEGGKGNLELAEQVLIFAENNQKFIPLIDKNDSIENKLNKIVTKIYGADGYELSSKAKSDLNDLKKNNWDRLSLIISKTPVSLTDNPKILGAPTGFKIQITDFIPKIGSGFIVALAGNVITMPGLPKIPAAQLINIDTKTKKIEGLS